MTTLFQLALAYSVGYLAGALLGRAYKLVTHRRKEATS